MHTFYTVFCSDFNMWDTFLITEGCMEVQVYRSTTKPTGNYLRKVKKNLKFHQKGVL